MARVGMLFTLDAVFAVMILASAFLLYSSIAMQPAIDIQPQYTSQDVLMSLNTLSLEELNNSWSQDIINDTGLQSSDSLLYALGYLYVQNDTRSQELISLLNESVPASVGLAISIQGTDLLRRSTPHSTGTLRTGYQQITGIDEGKPLEGTSSSAYLRRVRDKVTNTFVLFGGYVGQGNITQSFMLPSDVNSSKITGVTFEVDTPQEFSVLLNDIYCDTFTPNGINMSPDVFSLSHCNSSLQSEANQITIQYANLQQAYISGANLKVSYTTDTLSATHQATSTTYDFPQIQGVVNLYDGFFIPQTLTNLTARLVYEQNDPGAITFFTIGEKTVYESNETGLIDITLTNEDFQQAGVDYSVISNKTVPIRFANFNTTSEVIVGGDADVVLITDYSDSMKKSISDWSQGNSGNVRNCESQVYPDEDIRRTHLARCLDKEVVNIVMNYSGNRLWPVHFVDNEVYTYNNPEDKEALIGYYETTTSQFPNQGSGKTCLACALSEAYDVFANSYEENRTRHIILMSDGVPTHCTGAGCDSQSSVFGEEICEGVCDVPGQNCNEFSSLCTDSSCDPAINNMYEVAQALKNDFNVTVHTIGFGPLDTCSKAVEALQTTAIITNGTYATSNDVDTLIELYKNISYEILDTINLESQTAIIPQQPTLSTLYKESYIRADHHEVFEDVGQSQIEITRQTPQLASCSDTVSFPEELIIQEALLASYSGSHWTNVVTVNDQTIYNLSEYFVSYPRLGDPHRIYLPLDVLSSTNQLFVQTADSPTNITACSQNNSVIYTARVPAASARTPVLANADGCHWQIENDDASIQEISVPEEYNGANQCSYTSQDIIYDSTDALQVAVYELLSALDFDGDGSIFVSLESEDLEIILTQVGSVPFLWGPILVQTEVWR